MSDKIPVTKGSGNVFADLGLPDADLLLAKARMTAKLKAAMTSRGLTQTEVSHLGRTTQARISRMFTNEGRGYTLDKIIDVANTLGMNVEIKMTKARRKSMPLGSTRGRTIVKP